MERRKQHFCRLTWALRDLRTAVCVMETLKWAWKRDERGFSCWLSKKERGRLWPGGLPNTRHVYRQEKRAKCGWPTSIWSALKLSYSQFLKALDVFRALSAFPAAPRVRLLGLGASFEDAPLWPWEAPAMTCSPAVECGLSPSISAWTVPQVCLCPALCLRDSDPEPNLQTWLCNFWALLWTCFITTDLPEVGTEHKCPINDRWKVNNK